MGQRQEKALAPAEIEAALGLVLEKQGEDRLDAIIDSPDPRAVVQAMVPAEAFFTFALIQEDNQSTLLRLLSEEQIDYLIDLDLWEGDNLAPDRILDWLGRLWGADSDIAVAWLLRAQTELVVRILQILCTVSDGPSSQESLTEAQGKLPPFSAEGKIYINFHSEEAAAMLRGPLILLAGTDMEYYLAVMQDVLHVPPSYAEENAFKRRWGRLRDEGFLPPDEAYAVYRWPDTDELAQMEPEDNKTPSRTLGLDDPDAGAPSALALAQPEGLLATALEPLDDRQRDNLSRAVAVMSTRVLSADHLAFSDIDSHRRALEKTLGYVTIGLRHVVGDDPQRARRALVEREVASLFRVGYARVAALGRRATILKRRGWLSQVGLGVDVLGEPLASVVRTLGRPRPLYPAAALAGDKQDREFRDLDDLQECSEILDRVEALEKLFIDGLGLDLAAAEAFDLTGCQPPNPRELTLGLILQTAIANFLLDERLAYLPIPAQRLNTLVGRLGALELDGPREHVIRQLQSRLDDRGPDELSHVAHIVDESFAALQAALGGLNPEQPVDPKFVGAVVARDV